MGKESKHEDALCRCGDIEDVCSCPCQRCNEYRQSALRAKRRQDLEERLRKANIEPSDLADVIWMQIEPTIEARADKICRDTLRIVLKELRLVSQVQWASVDHPREKR